MWNSPLLTLCYQTMRLSFYCHIVSVPQYLPDTRSSSDKSFANIFSHSADCVSASPPSGIICCCCSVTKSCPTFRDPTDLSTPGFPVPHHLPEFARVCVQWVGDADTPSAPSPRWSRADSGRQDLWLLQPPTYLFELHFLHSTSFKHSPRTLLVGFLCWKKNP